MDNQTMILIFLSCTLIIMTIVFNASSSTIPDNNVDDERVKNNGNIKVFVFGDSYADTGNSKRPTAISWNLPYGISSPGKPDGRYSDGLVLTDFVALFLGQESPVSYNLRESADKSKLEHGMNFAFGGTGVFNTMENEPNMSVQINLFEDLLQQKYYTNSDLNSSIALVSLAGNDYAAFLANKGNKVNVKKDLVNLTTSIVNQLVIDLKRLQSLGVRKIGVTALEPLGCLPPFTASSSHQNCTEILNSVSKFHNQILKQSLKDLNDRSKNFKIVILDLYNAFMSAFETLQKNTTGNLALKNNPLKPCCVGTSNGYSCGSVNESTKLKEYKVCENPELSFFWDTIHPSQNGWRLVSLALQSSLHELVH